MSKRFESRNSLLFKAKNKIIWMKRVDGNFIRFHDYSQEFKLRKVRLGAVSFVLLIHTKQNWQGKIENILLSIDQNLLCSAIRVGPHFSSPK